MKNRIYSLIGILVILGVIGFIILKLLKVDFSGNRNEDKKTQIAETIRSQGKIIILEDKFSHSNIAALEKKYFDTPWLKGIGKSKLSVKGSMGFLIDLADTARCKLIFKSNELEIVAPLKLAYFALDDATIHQAGLAESDTKSRAGKNKIIQRIAEIALRENLDKMFEKAKKQTMEKQEKELHKLVKVPVTITLTGSPILKHGMELIKNQYTSASANRP